jgi:hypothetical protein
MRSIKLGAPLLPPVFVLPAGLLRSPDRLLLEGFTETLCMQNAIDRWSGQQRLEQLTELQVMVASTAGCFEGKSQAGNTVAYQLPFTILRCWCCC